MKKLFVFTLVILLGFTLAHSKPEKITPALGATVKTVSSVAIVFDEAIESQFSTFKVYAYTGSTSNGALRAFVKSKLAIKDNSAATRVDTAIKASGTTKNVTILLKPKLKAGTYVVLWRLLGADTHTVDSFSYFRIKP